MTSSEYRTLKSGFPEVIFDSSLISHPFSGFMREDSVHHQGQREFTNDEVQNEVLLMLSW